MMNPSEVVVSGIIRTLHADFYRLSEVFVQLKVHIDTIV